jgi:tetratricopeptide (TPR) repeat protein
MRFMVFVALLCAAAFQDIQAQSAASLIALGDRSYAALEAPAALSRYETALASEPRNYEALWKASRSAIDLGSYETDASKRAGLYRRGEQYARRALGLEPRDAEGHFALARALGKTALTQSPKGRIRYATEIRSQALKCLELNPRHPGCLHVMGMWNAEVMRLNSVTRMIAKNLLGGGVFGSASWKEAVRYMEAAVASEPDRIVHHLDLGEVYLNVKQTAKARAEFEAVLRLPKTDVNDGVYKEQAKAALASL